jgi:phosphatidate cytidylyltransferase
MLRWRLSLGVLLITVLAGLCWWDACAATPGAVLLPLALVLSVAVAGELLSLLSAHGNTPATWATYLGVVATVGGAGMQIVLPEVAADCPMGPWGGSLMGMTAGVVAVLLVEMYRYDQPGKATVNLALAVLTIVYAGLLMSFLIQLRLLNGGAESGNESWGMVAMLSLIVVVKMGDIGAYTVGRLIGRHKMAPRLSPGKTWEGLVGGLVFACVGSCAIFGWLVPRMRLEAVANELIGWEIIGWIVYGLVVGLAGVMGDLSVSLLKRDAGRKDSSHWMPGFGGVLDLLDSILIAAPVAYVLWVTGLIGP